MSNSHTANRAKSVVGLGEVLFDCFPDRKILGGAPINVAVHAHQLLHPNGGRGIVVSCVGEDSDGRAILQELSNRGIVTDFVQVDTGTPTGTVQVELNQSGEPSYQITAGVAWEQIRFEDSLDPLANNCGAVSFGSLAQRSEPSRSTIHRFLEQASSAICMFDVNLRQDFFTPEILDASFSAATAAKLNLEELNIVGDLLGNHSGEHKDTDSKIQNLQEHYGLDYVALTRGSQGTVLYHAGNRYEQKPPQMDRMPNADNVGAGDACTAGLIFGLLQEWPPLRILELANLMGAFVASRPGATPTLSDAILQLASE